MGFPVFKISAKETDYEIIKIFNKSFKAFIVVQTTFTIIVYLLG